MPVAGTLRARMMLVAKVPNGGAPDDNSKTDPTAAIAVIQDNPSNTPLLRVTMFS